ncbi:MAG TPA: class I SAM-dependent methyltransferase [Dehalococcoidia bacterium]|nr:class I SAM-dependent methyltransferase [Dehalococcoidia bacterium]
MTAENKNTPQVNLPRGLMGRITFIFMNMGHKSIYENMAKVLALKPEDDLLEVACGNGYFLKKYASHVNSITGLDISELSVKMATSKNKGRVVSGTAEFVQGDASKLPWEDNKFSVAASMASFPGFPKPLEALKEMHRVLRSGGRAVVSIEWNAEDGQDHSKQASKYGYHIWSEDDIRTMLTEAGFSDITFSYAKGMMMPRMMLARGTK